MIIKYRILFSEQFHLPPGLHRKMKRVSFSFFSLHKCLIFLDGMTGEGSNITLMYPANDGQWYIWKIKF